MFRESVFSNEEHYRDSIGNRRSSGSRSSNVVVTVVVALEVNCLESLGHGCRTYVSTVTGLCTERQFKSTLRRLSYLS